MGTGKYHTLSGGEVVWTLTVILAGLRLFVAVVATVVVTVTQPRLRDAATSVVRALERARWTRHAANRCIYDTRAHSCIVSARIVQKQLGAGGSSAEAVK